jgi:hypothetical protein
MNRNRSKDLIPEKLRPDALNPRGFALVVTLSLMILLTIIAVGLLTLSGISLRSSAQGDAMQSARANARMALMMAIGDLQKQLGPDTRISVTADQTAGSDPSTSSAPQAQRHWAGAYKSWPAALPNVARPTPEFLQWFVSGDPTRIKNKDFATTTVPGNTVEIVTKKTVGPGGDPVTVPLITQSLANGTKNKLAWWVSDLGTKGLLAEGKDVPTAIADIRADQQSAPTSNFKSAAAGATKPFNALALNDSRFSNLATWQTSALLADKPENIRGLFHDLTTQSRGLITNVRAGGFRKDLSMELERPLNSAPNPTNTALYKVGGETGINLHELWTYYNLASTSNMPSTHGLQKAGSATFTTGGSMSSGTPHFKLLSSPTACREDNAFFFKQPVIISYQLVLSFQTRLVGSANRLHIVVDPIITFWNPLDVPVVVPPGVLFTVKYWQVPYSIWIKKNGQLQEYPIAGISRGDGNFLSLEVGALESLVFKPGEVLKMSQSADLLARSAVPDIHALAGKKGFLFGKGVAMEATTRAGAKIDVSGNETLVFDSAKPNDLTAGASAKDGRGLSGGVEHSRHFSVTHHEYYIGKDRGAETTSLGIGGMYLDWDFGNKRLAPAAIRGTNDPGTKPTTDRYYANQKSEVFKSFTDGRSIPTSGSKMPFMLLSFNAKTEAGSLLGTRSLSRFNPKALHVDFYDLGKPERDMLPYEYTTELLNGWKSNNDSLQQDASGRGYFGGAMNALDGTNYVTTHSVPREPIVSLAAFQHSFANGFDIQKPKYGYAILNAREPMLPQISHAIGNSLACPVIASNKTEGTLSGGRPMADHSYLANQALWDEWFLSGITPQSQNTFAKSRTQKDVALEFFNTDPATHKDLPVVRYSPNLRGKTPTEIVNSYISGSIPSNTATTQIASYLNVDGLFNVNSTSVEAWKTLLGSRKGRPVIVRDSNGKESKDGGDSDTPVAGLLGPENLIAKGTLALKDTAQWVGRRTLTDDEIDSLARAIVEEVRKRGPFLSLADFVNRRVGNDADLARSGAIQSALDSNKVPINAAYNSRAASGGSNLAFKQAEQGPISYGIPGIVKQADILTPIAPILSARSDSFLIRGYGEKTDNSGKVIARAWCEAVVQRSADFVDPADLPEKTYSTISTLNKNFGRRFDIVSFRWLNPSEA